MGSLPHRAFEFDHFSIDLRVLIRISISVAKQLEHFEVRKEYAMFRPVRLTSFAEVSELMIRVVLRCREERIAKLVINTTGLPGLQPPAMADRYNLAVRIASDAASKVKIAHVASPKWVRSGNFALTLASNRGLDAENFLSGSTAVQWLLRDK
jgi:hypothetical protein